MIRTPIIAGNWKCNKTLAEAVALAEGVMVSTMPYVDTVEVVLCPPFTVLSELNHHLEDSAIRMGAQNVYIKEGAFTGEVAPRMLEGLCRYIIIGHSERRHVFGESDEMVNAKVKAVLALNFTPILCVGETLEQNERGETEAVISSQVRAGLKDVEGGQFVAVGGVIAYEPVWAIGTGKPCHGDTANNIIGMIRRLLGELYGAEAAQAIRIQYGGSVNAKNAGEFMEQPEIDGCLVGGASLQAYDFTEIIRWTAEIYRTTKK